MGIALKVIGIDESNHGRIPEVFVATYSEDDMQIAKSSWPMKKNRFEADSNTLKNIMSAFQAKHIVFDNKYKSVFGDDFIKVIALSEFIKYYGSADLIIFDGTLEQKNLSFLEQLVFPRKMPQLIVEPKADQTYPVVHSADAIANLLYKHYDSCKGVMNKFDGYLLTPDFEYYKKILK